MKTIYLSYFINPETPLYGGEKSIKVDLRSEISKGASSNTKHLYFPNHTGTHIDFPNHFSDTGKTINDYPAGFWTFNNVFIIDLPGESEKIIETKDINIKEIPPETDFLIIKTGFGKFREDKIYWNNNPGLAPEFAGALKERCAKLRAVGFDFISVSSYQNRELGRKAHKEFLINNNILLIEDMNLGELDDSKIKSIIALPLLVDKIDGSPITVIAEIT